MLYNCSRIKGNWGRRHWSGDATKVGWTKRWKTGIGSSRCSVFCSLTARIEIIDGNELLRRDVTGNYALGLALLAVGA
jgi:hypothetical protein